MTLSRHQSRLAATTDITGELQEELTDRSVKSVCFTVGSTTRGYEPLFEHHTRSRKGELGRDYPKKQKDDPSANDRYVRKCAKAQAKSYVNKTAVSV